MNNYFIYLAGGMMGLTHDAQREWRTIITNRFIDMLTHISKLYKVHITNPVNYYNFDVIRHKTEEEVMNFDLHKLRNSNLVIVNFNAPNSLGTMAELAVAHEHNIPIIGLNEHNNKLHPWQECMSERIFDNIEDLIDYVTEFYLN